MTTPTQESQPQEQKPSDKELNFRALEAKFQRELQQERQAREQLERQLQERQAAQVQQEDDSDSEPYVDHKKLNKTLQKWGQQTQSEIQKAMEVAKAQAKEEVKRELWLKSNPDFYEVLQHAEKFAQKDPELAETILEMPEGFERQKLVYKNIKALGLHKPEQKQASIQDKVDANRRSPYYQPSGVGAAPYAQAGDFSAAGQKNAYQKMQELKKQLRI